MLSRNDILNSTHDGLDVFRHYFGNNLRVGRRFRNPFYQDTNASCSIYYDRKYGVYRFKDFGNEDFSGDCFALVARLHNLSCSKSSDFIEVMRIIDHDLNLGLSDDPAPQRARIRTQPTIQEQDRKKPIRYNYEARPFSDKELQWWGQYGIDAETLQRFGVVSLSEFNGVSNTGHSYTFRSTLTEPMYGYLLADGIKIYRPKSKSRFVYGGSIKDYYCFGLNQLPATGDTLFITGGEKDVLSLSAHGFPAICFGSETARISHKLVEELSHRFHRIAILYDMDETGVRQSEAMQKELKQFRVERFELPLSGTKQEKDISDFFRQGHTAEELKRIISPRPILKQYPRNPIQKIKPR